MQILGGGECNDRNEPSTSGVTYLRNESSKMYISIINFDKFNSCYKYLQLLKDKVVLPVLILDYIFKRKLKGIIHVIILVCILLVNLILFSYLITLYINHNLYIVQLIMKT